MKKYCRITPVNTYEREIDRSINDIVLNDPINPMKLLNIREVETNTYGGKTKNIEYAPVDIICEYVEKTTNNDEVGRDCFIDVITGKKFWGVVEGCDNLAIPSKEIVVKKYNDVSIEVLASYLKRFTAEDLIRYQEAINRLEVAMIAGYESYLSRKEQEIYNQKTLEEYTKSSHTR